MKAYHQTDFGTLYCGDCLDILPTLADKSVDLVLTDPPYGIKMSKGSDGYGVSAGRQYSDTWDSSRPSTHYFDAILSFCVPTLIFGGNYFADILPRSTHWVVWDKVGNTDFNNPFSDCELIWTNIKKNSTRKMVYIQQGFISQEKTRYHPTQKPVGIVGGLISNYTQPGNTILDPFAGSGTTAIACIRYNRKYILIEKEEKYCEIAAKRIERELDQTTIDL